VWFFASLTTISRTLTRVQISKRSLSRAAAERKELRALWELEVAQLGDPDLFVFVDESAVDNKTVQRPPGMVGYRWQFRFTMLQVSSVQAGRATASEPQKARGQETEGWTPWYSWERSRNP